LTENLHSVLTKRIDERYSAERCTLDSFQCYDPRQQEALDRLRGIAKNPDQFIDTGRGIVLFGATGTGKFHLLAAILNAVPKRYKVEFVTLSALSQERRAGLDFVSPDVLVLTDPQPFGSEATHQELYAIVNARYRAQRSTWLAIDSTDTKDLIRIVSGPVWDRLKGAEIIECSWPAYRDRPASARR
jgi:DNA replication protein DnaC